MTDKRVSRGSASKQVAYVADSKGEWEGGRGKTKEENSIIRYETGERTAGDDGGGQERGNMLRGGWGLI